MEILILIAIGWGVYMWLFRDTSEPQPPESESQSNDRTPESTSTTYRRQAADRSASRVPRTADKVTSETIIKRAIERNRDVSFRYVDQNGEITTRTVKPLRLEKRHEKKILCLVALCHLRKAERSFVVWRMRHVKAL